MKSQKWLVLNEKEEIRHETSLRGSPACGEEKKLLHIMPVYFVTVLMTVEFAISARGRKDVY